MKDPSLKKRPSRFEPFIYPVDSITWLSKNVKTRRKPFINVLLSRRSNTSFTKLTKNEIGTLLHLCTKITDVWADDFGFILTKRTTPSAGARHPIDLLISPANGNRDKRDIYYYNPISHTLGKLSLLNQSKNEFFKEINTNLSIGNATIIWFSIQTKKTSAKYLHAQSLYWRDAGALLYCIQLVSSYLDYKSCPIGSLCTSSFYNLFKNKSLISGGGILLGK